MNGASEFIPLAKYPTNSIYQPSFKMNALNSYGVVIFITCLQSLRLTPPLRAAETKFVNPPMQIREDIRNAYVINDKGISRNVVARSSFCAAAKLRLVGVRFFTLASKGIRYFTLALRVSDSLLDPASILYDKRVLLKERGP